MAVLGIGIGIEFGIEIEIEIGAVVRHFVCVLVFSPFCSPISCLVSCDLGKAEMTMHRWTEKREPMTWTVLFFWRSMAIEIEIEELWAVSKRAMSGNRVPRSAERTVQWPLCGTLPAMSTVERECGGSLDMRAIATVHPPPEEPLTVQWIGCRR